MKDGWITNFVCVFKIRYNFLPSSFVILIIVPEPSITLLVIEGLFKESIYCSIVSMATVSLMIVKLDRLRDCAPCATNVIASFTSTPDIATVKGWIPGPEVTRY